MRIVFMGTPEFALPTLERLIESKHEIVAVVTQPDKPAGRGHQLTAPPVKARALEAGLDVLQPDKLRKSAFHTTLAGYRPDAAVVVAYGKILPAEMLAVPRHGCFNVHASMLPRWRGAAPIQRAIAAGDTKTGVTIMKLDEGMDTGPVIRAEEVEILDDDDHISLANMLSVLGADLMLRTLDQLERDGVLPLLPQDESRATYAPPITRADAAIDWATNNKNVICLIRAMLPWPAAFTTLRGVEWKLLAVEPFTTPDGDAIIPEKGTPPGQVIALVRGRGFAVATAGGSVLVRSVKLPGKKDVDAADILNARLLREGDLFVKSAAAADNGA